MELTGMERLREHLHRHNRWVLLLTVLTFVVSCALWAGLYFIVWWLFLLGGTAVRPLDFHPGIWALFRGFAAMAVVLCLVAWVLRLVRPNAAARDHKGVGEHFLDVLLALPRVTLAIFGTGGAAARLNERELGYAWRLLRMMDDADRPVPVTMLPVEIPDSTMRNRIVLALQLSGLIEIRTTSSGPVLAFQNNEARSVAQEKVRLRV
jgi:hypothetical protein